MIAKLLRCAQDVMASSSAPAKASDEVRKVRTTMGLSSGHTLYDWALKRSKTLPGTTGGNNKGMANKGSLDVNLWPDWASFSWLEVLDQLPSFVRQDIYGRVHITSYGGVVAREVVYMLQREMPTTGNFLNFEKMLTEVHSLVFEDARLLWLEYQLWTKKRGAVQMGKLMLVASATSMKAKDTTAGCPV
eukprot:scaffold7453_cov31-Prasinocladus_malaysianus.AAC.2